MRKLRWPAWHPSVVLPLSYRLRPNSTLRSSPALFDHATLNVAGNPGPANRLMPRARIMVHPAFALLRPDAGQDSTP